MDHSKFDTNIKKIIQEEELEAPISVKNRVHHTLSNLPKKKQSFTFPIKYLLSGAVCIFLTIGAIYFLTNENTRQPSETRLAEEKNGKDENIVIHDYLYAGESEHWRAIHEFYGKGVFAKKKDGRIGYNSESEELFYIEYKGEFAEIKGKPLSYSYKTTAGGSGRSLDQMDKKSFTNHSGPDRGAAMMQENETVEVTVEWDEKKETFLLHPDNTRNWNITPTFPAPSDGGNQSILRGLKGKAVYMDLDDIKAGKAYKTRWFFWGKGLKENPGEQLKITATQKDTGKRIEMVRANNWEITLPQTEDLKDVLKAQASQHVMMNFPSSGVWRLDAHIGNKYYASIVLEVK
ncbi:hypothetical protein RRV45_04745 [Bacillus sp. DTU_2020_1000418_1_SI_GHA_SEK_038]|uniref:hypothetical protein n=1 Tax=Bacillus sp. DTU_2020_1000418_1_SI_GHA_SEK_038 TaxID=3077585 RepID=UPI0028F07796|nr:hypothetical protein [Bacillus sp. DTU_2020_1000418_1_SI_GHA_SEK_038]WNS76320.1 hypothetical protein RRV45_04745 [Bacillus sp. DTU_2020_1000418_1_SI_GHA_SEK_038]